LTDNGAWTWTADSYSSQDWTNPVDDDDPNESLFFCQQYTQLEKDADTLLYDIACKSIKCITQRTTTTSDAIYDA
jgi:hypothetical protein